jgi:hypothetical protein
MGKLAQGYCARGVLTYMSILGKIEEQRAAGKLFLLPLAMRSERPVRTMLVSPELYGQLTGANWRTREEATRFGKLRGDLEHFIIEGQISMHLNPHERKLSRAAKSAYMGLLDHPRNGIFDIRSRDPSPALRVLGGHAIRDIFVALKCHPRSVAVDFLDLPPLGPRESKEWALAIGTCMDHWKELFGEDKPITGSDPDVFLTRNKFVV